MSLYAWSRPVASPHFPLDHTWVTTFDGNNPGYVDEHAVANANEKFWFCHGVFHQTGHAHDPNCRYLARGYNFQSLAEQLVTPNCRYGTGTIIQYGVDGVCHQVSNQILYATLSPQRQRALTVSRAWGYTLSSGIFNTYGLNPDWYQHRQMHPLAPQSRPNSLVVIQRLQSICRVLGFPVDQIQHFTGYVRHLHDGLRLDLQQIGRVAQQPQETTADRAMVLSARIDAFLRDVFAVVERDAIIFRAMFGIPPDIETNLVQADLFRFAD